MRLLLVATCLALSLVLADSALAGWKDDAQLVRKRIVRAQKAGLLTPSEAGSKRELLRQSTNVLRRLPGSRATELEGVLHDVAEVRAPYTSARAFALFQSLRENARYLGAHPVPRSGHDELAPDGAVLREMPGHGLRFHPLASFARLNQLLGAHDDEAAAELADALVERAIADRGALVWEYLFPFGGGRPPWTSGMAQAVAAQALARAGRLDAAAAAERAVPRLTTEADGKPWIRLYSFSSNAVLNAQLQTVLSLRSYAEEAADDAADALAARLEASAQSLLPSFDTGYWSLYSLRGGDAPVGYHEYVIALLRRLAAETDDESWRAVADRFAAYESEPPLLDPRGAGPLTIWPDPADGFLDETHYAFWLSKRSTVTLRAGPMVETLVLNGGRHSLPLRPGYAKPGTYKPRLVAVDENGHRVELALAPVHVRVDNRPPAFSVHVVGPRRIAWEAVDPGTPWLHLTAKLDHGRRHVRLDLGHRGLNGSATLRLPPKGPWHVLLTATNSAGRSVTRSLGELPRQAATTTDSSTPAETTPSAGATPSTDSTPPADATTTADPTPSADETPPADATTTADGTTVDGATTAEETPSPVEPPEDTIDAP